MTSVPAPMMSAPIEFRKLARSTMWGSLAAFSMTVMPLASTAASNNIHGGPHGHHVQVDLGAVGRPVGGGGGVNKAVFHLNLRPHGGKNPSGAGQWAAPPGHSRRREGAPAARPKRPSRAPMR